MLRREGNAVDTLREQVVDAMQAARNPAERAQILNQVRQMLHELSPCSAAPVDCVLLVPVEYVEPNDYNPNSVAQIEMGLLLHSIRQDGYTQPVVTVYDAERDRYVIVDGFHRYYVMKNVPEIYERYSGLLPITVIDKPPAARMASTVRHNRARGRHVVGGMASLVFQMLDQGMSDADVCNELGMEPEELLRLKHITGFSKLFADQEYGRAWMSRNQAKIRRQHRRQDEEACASS